MNIETMNLRDVAEQAHRTNVEHGFCDGPVDIDRKLLLIIGELVEAQNELRNGHAVGDIYYYPGSCIEEPSTKPEGFVIELADAGIRLLGLAQQLGLDIQAAFALKMAYNDTRPYKHGKQF